MRTYLIKATAFSVALICLHFEIVVSISSPIEASYWVREALVIKRYIASQLPSPKIVLVGGSNVLFGIDARLIEHKLGIPTVNFGLHAALSLATITGEAARIVKRGDILILSFEPGFYAGSGITWTDFQLRNSVAWGHEYFDSLSFPERLNTVFVSGRPTLSVEITIAKLGALFEPSAYSERLAALANPEEIVERYYSGTLRNNWSVYSAYNLSDRGDIILNIGASYQGIADPASVPVAISSETKRRLAQFVTAMKQSGVRVLVAYAPYLIDGNPAPGWKEAEKSFAANIKDIGAEQLGTRDDLFFPRSDFFDTAYHLNETGRRARTERMIMDLRRIGLGARHEGTDLIDAP